MCLCKNNWIESQQIKIRENEALRFIWLHKVHNISCVMLQHKFFETETYTHNLLNEHIVIPER